MRYGVMSTHMRKLVQCECYENILFIDERKPKSEILQKLKYCEK